MTQDTQIPINLNIADRQYRVKVAAADEITVRHSVKTINDKMVEYKTNFPGMDMQDYISMVLLWFATEVKVNGHPGVDDEIVLEKLEQIEKQLDAVM